MKNSIILVLVIIVVVSCDAIASDLLCQIYDKSRRSLEQYCHNYNAILPEMCADQTGEIDRDDVLHLKLGGCDPDHFVANAIKAYDRIRTLDLSHSAYTSLDWLDLRLPHLERFNASNNEISSAPPWLFRNARRIIEIDLSHNKLATIDRDAFQAAKRLTKIHLRYNRLQENERDSFGVAQRLQYLDLKGNRYAVVPILSKNQHLTELHLEENPIRSFSCRYFDAMNVGEDDDKSDGLSVHLSWKNVTLFDGHPECSGRKMSIVSNSSMQGVLFTANGHRVLHCGGRHTFEMLRNFTAGKESFENVTDILPCLGAALETINLSDNHVNKLNETILSAFAKLKRIALRNTNLTEFNFNWFVHQQEINELNISANNLTQLENYALLNGRQWEKLRDLNLAENRLKNTLEILKSLRPMLRYLNVAGNFIGQLNATTLDQLKALETINLASTNLTITNGTNPFDRLNRLSSIDLSNNHLEAVDMNAFASTLKESNEFRASNCRLKNATNVIDNLGPLTKLLDLSGNFIGELHPELFESFPYLKYLNLSNANLTKFNPITLVNQYNLRSLDLSQNQLNEIDVSAMSMKLESFNLNGNDLTKIDHLKRWHFPRLKSMRISSNRFDCDYLVTQIKREWKEIPFTDDPYDQQQNENCFSNYTKNAILIGVVMATGAIAAIVSVFGPFVTSWIKCSK